MSAPSRDSLVRWLTWLQQTDCPRLPAPPPEDRVTTDCVRCGRPMPDQAYACSSCAYRAGDQLHDIADMADAARDVAHGLSSRQNGSGGSGKPGSRLPLDLAATARLDAVEGELATWARHVAETRGVPLP